MAAPPFRPGRGPGKRRRIGFVSGQSAPSPLGPATGLASSLGSACGPTFIHCFQYQALAQPPLGSIGTRDWFVPFAEPVRPIRRTPDCIAFVTVVAAAVTADKWFTPLVDPVRRKPQTPDCFAYSESAQFPEAVTESRWHQPWSEPVRPKPRTPDHSAQLTPPAVIDWHQRLTEPTLRKPQTPDWFAFGRAAPFPESVTEDRWHQPWSEPVRRRPAALRADQPLVLVTTVATEVVTVDKWARPLSEPVRSKPSLTKHQDHFAFVNLGGNYPPVVNPSTFTVPPWPVAGQVVGHITLATSDAATSWSIDPASDPNDYFNITQLADGSANLLISSNVPPPGTYAPIPIAYNAAGRVNVSAFGFVGIDAGVIDSIIGGGPLYTSEVSAFSNIGHMVVAAPTDVIVSRVAAMRAAGLKTVLAVNEIFFVSNTTLRADAGARWSTFTAANAAVDLTSLAAIYIADEPTLHGMTFADLQAASDAVKATLPTIPVMYVESYLSLSSMQVPASADIVGFDQYQVDPLSAAYLGQLTTLKTKLASNQNVVLVVDGEWPSTGGAFPSATYQAIAPNYLTVAQRDPRIVMMLTYIWPGGVGSPTEWGVRDFPAPVQAVYQTMGGTVLAGSTSNVTIQGWPFPGPLSDPTRPKPRTPDISVLGRATPFPESVSEDRWHQPWSDPPKPKPRAPVYEPATRASPPSIIKIDWFAPLSEPIVKVRRPVASYPPLAHSPRVEIVTVDKWVYGWSEPVRYRRFHTALQQALVTPGRFGTFLVSTIRLATADTRDTAAFGAFGILGITVRLNVQDRADVDFFDLRAANPPARARVSIREIKGLGTGINSIAERRPSEGN